MTFDEVSKVSFMCWPNDLDTNLHMNNGRYLTLLDLVRADLMIRTGLFKKLIKYKWMPVLVSAKIEFRKSIHLWEKFDIQTQLIGYDEKRFYIEQFIYNKKKELIFKAVVKAAFVKKKKSVSVKEIFETLGEDKVFKKLPEHIQLWQASEKMDR